MDQRANQTSGVTNSERMKHNIVFVVLIVSSHIVQHICISTFRRFLDGFHKSFTCDFDLALIYATALSYWNMPTSLTVTESNKNKTKEQMRLEKTGTEKMKLF